MDNKNIYTAGLGLLAGLVLGYYGYSLSLNGNQNESVKVENNNVQFKVEEVKKNLSKVIKTNFDVENLNKKICLNEIKVKAGGREDKMYVNDKGSVFYAKALDLDIPKKDKPEVELFVMSYCPYGTQMEKSFIPVVKKFGDKIDAKVRFVDYAMHPSKGEVEENLLQYCIQKEEPKKYYDYLACFLDKAETDKCLAKVGIKKDDLKTCLDETDKKYNVTKNLEDKASWNSGMFPKFEVEADLNKKYGVQGSPTLVINGKVISWAGRDQNSIFKAICSAFTKEPEICKETMSTEIPSAGFGYDKNSNVPAVGGSCGQ